jgi:NADPH2:quinone reductase
MFHPALIVTAIGAPLSLAQRPTPRPTSNQILIKVTVGGLNPHDQKARDTGLFIADSLPAVLGNDVVGTVAAVGSDVLTHRVGDRVVGQPTLEPGSRQTALQAYAVLDVAFTAIIPAGVSDDEAASLPTNVIAPLVGLFSEGSGLGIPAPWTEAAETFDYAGQTLLIIGGGSACGKFAVQLARLAGIGRIVVVGSERSRAEVLRYGATDVILRGSEDVQGQIREIVGDDLIYAIDCVNSGDDQLLGLNALSEVKRGKMARLVRPYVDESKVKGKKAGVEVKNVFGISHFNAALCTPFWQRLAGYLQEGKIMPLAFQVVEGLDTEKVNMLLDQIRDGESVLKVHVHP